MASLFKVRLEGTDGSLRASHKYKLQIGGFTTHKVKLCFIPVNQEPCFEWLWYKDGCMVGMVQTSPVFVLTRFRVITSRE